MDAAIPAELLDRADAGRRLARRLRPMGLPSPLVIGIARGGVVVAAEIAKALNGELDLVVVRKIGDPASPEYGLGAIVEGGFELLDDRRIAEAGYRRTDLAPTLVAERRELERRVGVYRAHRPRIDPAGRTVVLVDDGIATAGTARAALRELRSHAPARLLLALGVAPAAALPALRGEADDVRVALAPEEFSAVGEWYRSFEPVSDAEVLAALRAAGASTGSRTPRSPSTGPR